MCKMTTGTSYNVILDQTVGTVTTREQYLENRL